jgi:hypothetical protein
MESCTPAARAASEHVCVMEEAVEERGHGGGVAEELAQSSTGRLEVRIVDARSEERRISARRSSAAVGERYRMPRSSVISSRTGAKPHKDLLARVVVDRAART